MTTSLVDVECFTIFSQGFRIDRVQFNKVILHEMVNNSSPCLFDCNRNFPSSKSLTQFPNPFNQRFGALLHFILLDLSRIRGLHFDHVLLISPVKSYTSCKHDLVLAFHDLSASRLCFKALGSGLRKPYSGVVHPTTSRVVRFDQSAASRSKV